MSLESGHIGHSAITKPIELETGNTEESRRQLLKKGVVFLAATAVVSSAPVLWDILGGPEFPLNTPLQNVPDIDSSDKLPDKETIKEVISFLEDVSSADVAVYGLKDDEGNSMDALKIIQSSNIGYLGVYHYWDNECFRVCLASSVDLVNWNKESELDDYASQAKILQVDGHYLLAEEKNMLFGSNIMLKYYDTEENLRKGKEQDSILLPRSKQLLTFNEGTPSIESVKMRRGIRDSHIELRYHDRTLLSGDREAVGTLENFDSKTWRRNEDTKLNKMFQDRYHVRNIGGRDSIVLNGRQYHVFEAGNDFSSLRPYLKIGSELHPLNIHTDKGSKSFGNITITLLTLPNGKRGLVSTEYIFSEGNPTEEWGTLMYYKEIE